MNVFRAGSAEDVQQSCLVHFPVHDFGSNAGVAQQPGQFACGKRVFLLAMDDKFVKSYDAVIHDWLYSVY
jgi:hypothetical protein